MLTVIEILMIVNCRNQIHLFITKAHFIFLHIDCYAGSESFLKSVSVGTSMLKCNMSSHNKTKAAA